MRMPPNVKTEQALRTGACAFNEGRHAHAAESDPRDP